MTAQACAVLIDDGIDPDFARESREWVAQIKVNGKRTWLGYFEAEADAARAYDVAARRLHGSFACLNFPEEVGHAAR